MPVFRNVRRSVYALISYKVLYSKFAHAPQWQSLGDLLTPRIMARALIKDRPQKVLMVMRSPYDRAISCFMDKFRKQPTRIDEPNFEWQSCHRLMFPYAGITSGARSQLIADQFLAWTFDEFIEALSFEYRHDAHFHPQSWTRAIHVFGRTLFYWPGCEIVRLENSEELGQIPDIDWSVRSNATGHLTPDFELEEKHKAVIRTLYRSDFRLGGYPH
jgi:hypothetical protein